MDVHNSFLLSDCEEDVYMNLPSGFECSILTLFASTKILIWLETSSLVLVCQVGHALKEYRFFQSYSDYFLSTFIQKSVQINVLVYVDDIIISGNPLLFLLLKVI